MINVYVNSVAAVRAFNAAVISESKTMVADGIGCQLSQAESSACLRFICSSRQAKRLTARGAYTVVGSGHTAVSLAKDEIQVTYIGAPIA